MLSTPRRWYRSVTLGLSLLVLCVFQVARAERLPIKIYTTADGLPNNNINKIVRDSRGFLWFCTAEGLSLFDGHSFVNFGIDDGLPHANVNDILETAAGEYWVATQGGLCRFKPRTYSDRQNELSSARGQPASPSRLFEPVGPADDDSRARTFTVLLQSRDGTVWCGTGKGMFYVQKSENNFVLVKVDIGLAPDQSNFITTLLEDRHGTLWIGTAKDLHRRWPDGSVAHCGSAATQCGMAPPFRVDCFIPEATPPTEEAQPPVIKRFNGKAEPYRTVRRQSRERALTDTAATNNRERRIHSGQAKRSICDNGVLRLSEERPGRKRLSVLAPEAQRVQRQV